MTFALEIKKNYCANFIVLWPKRVCSYLRTSALVRKVASVRKYEHHNIMLREKVSCHLAECKVAECKLADCQVAEGRFVECQLAECQLAECRFADGKLAKCHLAECKLAECQLA